MARRWRVDQTYTVYVEEDEVENVEEIATEYLDENFAHAMRTVVTPLVVAPDDFTFRLFGWAKDMEREPENEQERRVRAERERRGRIGCTCPVHHFWPGAEIGGRSRAECPVHSLTERRTILVHLNVSPPEGDLRSADDIAVAIRGAVEVGSDDDSVRELDVAVALAEEI